MKALCAAHRRWFPVRDGNRSKIICGSKEWTAQRQRKSPRIIRATARHSCHLKKSYSGIANWPCNMAIRQTGLFRRRENMGNTTCGKTTTLAVIREGAENEGYRVEGFAPTSRAAQKLAEAGMETSTLQKHLARGQEPDTGEKRLYVLDESRWHRPDKCMTF